MITLAGVIPDIDGLGIIPELLTRNSAHPLLWFSEYHHQLHNLAFGLLVTGVAFGLARQKWKTALLVLVSFHLHLFEDLIGARGPDGYQWPIPYLWPFSRGGGLVWSGQWALNAWPNFVITTWTAFDYLLFGLEARVFAFGDGFGAGGQGFCGGAAEEVPVTVGSGSRRFYACLRRRENVALI